MEITKVTGAGTRYLYKWPTNEEEFHSWIDYEVRDGSKLHSAKIGFGNRPVYGKLRPRVIVWIDGAPEVEFFGVDDYDRTGEIITELKVRGNKLCKYPSESVPFEYSPFQTVGMRNRVTGGRVGNAWGVVTSISDHTSMIRMGFLRKRQRGR